MNKRPVAILIGAGILILLIAFIKTGSFGVLDPSNEGRMLLPLILAAALIDSINPCALSILFVTIAFLFSLGKSRSDIVKIGASYIFGIFAVYVLIGLGILKALQLFNTPHIMARAGAVVLLAFGAVSLIGHFFPSFPIKLKIPSISHGKMAVLIEKGSIPAALGLGVLVGLFEFPCTGGPYLLVLGLLHDQGTYLKGFLYLILYNLVFILPLAVILLFASDHAVMQRLEQWKKDNIGSVKLWTGLAMVGLGIIMLMFY